MNQPLTHELVENEYMMSRFHLSFSISRIRNHFWKISVSIETSFNFLGTSRVAKHTLVYMF